MKIKIKIKIKKRKLIGLSGRARAGKDTVASMLSKKGYKRLAFADALRDAVYKLNPIVSFEVEKDVGFRFVTLQEIVDEKGWDVAKTEYSEIRRLLQVMGTEVGREIFGANCWVDIVERELEKNLAQNVVITDMRFPNELEMLKAYEGTSVRVLNDRAVVLNNHASEAFLEGVELELDNNGTLEDLEANVHKLVKSLEKHG